MQADITDPWGSCQDGSESAAVQGFGDDFTPSTGSEPDSDFQPLPDSQQYLGALGMYSFHRINLTFLITFA